MPFSSIGSYIITLFIPIIFPEFDHQSVQQKRETISFPLLLIEIINIFPAFTTATLTP